MTEVIVFALSRELPEATRSGGGSADSWSSHMVEKSENSLTKTLQAVAKTKLHEQIVNQVQALIEKGGLKHGDQLPPERELASIFKVSRHTVREAIRILEQKNILRSRPGSGTFIILEDESNRPLLNIWPEPYSEKKIRFLKSFNSENYLNLRLPGLRPGMQHKGIFRFWKTFLKSKNKSLATPLSQKSLMKNFIMLWPRLPEIPFFFRW